MTHVRMLCLTLLATILLAAWGSIHAKLWLWATGGSNWAIFGMMLTSIVMPGFIMAFIADRRAALRAREQ